MPGITSKIINGARMVTSNTAQGYIGGALALGAAGIVTSAFNRRPEASTKTKYLGNLMFPSDLVDPSADRNFYMGIQFMEYQRRSIFNQPFLSALGGIRLPIPNNLEDRMDVNFDSSAKDEPTQGAAIEAGIRGRNGAGSSGGIMSSIGQSIAGGLGGAAVGLASSAGTAAGLNVATALQLGGLAQNPFLTVLFNAPTFKRHQFSWKLTPNSEQESNTIREIIQTFKSNMLPAMAPNAGGTLLTYPNMAIISLYPDETFLYKFKPCVIESLSVNFAAGGTPSFFKNTNAPTQVKIDVNLLEIEYWLKEDIENSSFRSGGGFFG